MRIKALKITCFLLGAALFAGLAFEPTPAQSQDWNADDNSIEARRAERYQQLVDQSPEESYAFNQMMQSVGKGSAYEKLIKTYEQKVAKKPDNYNLRMVLGHIYRYGGRLDQAMQSYREAEKIKSTALVAMSIARVEAESKNFVEATNAYERALSMTTSKDQKVEILRAIAEMAIARRDMNRAKTAFGQLIELDDSLFLRRELAQIYEQNHMLAEARQTLAEAKNARGISTDEKYRLDLDIGTLWEEEYRDDEALKVYDALETKLSAGHWMKREISSRKIDIARRAGDLENLLATLETQWKSPSVEQRLELAQLYDETGKADKAEEQYKKAISAQSDNAEAREKYIAFLRSHGRVDDANKARVDRLKVKSLSNNFEYHYELYEAYLQQKRTDDAIKVLDQARNVFKSDFDKLQRIADAYLLHGRSSKALEIYATEVKNHPNDINAIEALGDYYDMQNQKAQALQTWKKIETINMDKTTRLETLARIYDEHGYADEALALYASVVKANPNDCQVLKSHAEVLSRNGKISEAVSAYEQLRDTCRTDAVTQVAARAVAQIQSSRGNGTKAIRQAVAQAQLAPDNDTLTRYAALLALALDMPQKAIETVESYTAAHPNDDAMKHTLVSLYEAANDSEKARQTLESLTEQSTMAARRNALIALAEFNENHGEFEEARKNLGQALEIDANDAQTNEKLADILTKLRLYAEAANYYQEASLIDAQNKSYAYKYATSLSMTGRDAEADEIYLQIVSHANDETLILKAAERAIDYHAWKNDLGSLQNAWKPLLYANQHKELYVEILIRVANLQARPHIQAILTKSARAAIADRHALHELSETYARAITEAMLSSDVSLATQGLNAAEWLANASVIETLANQIDEASNNTLDRDKQLVAVRAMAHAQLPVAVPKLVKIYNDASHPRALREHALWALGLIPGKDAQKALTEALDAPVDSFRMLAILGLARQNVVSEKITQLAKSDPSRAVQNVAAWAVTTQQSNNASLDTVLKRLQPSYSADNFAEVLADATSNNVTSDIFHPYQLWMISQLSDDLAAQRRLEVLWIVGGDLRTHVANSLTRSDAKLDLSAITPFEAQGRIFDTQAGYYANHINLEAMLDDAVSQRDGDVQAPTEWLVQHKAALQAAIQRVLAGSNNAVFHAARLRMLDDLTAPNGVFGQAIADTRVEQAVREALMRLKPQFKTWIETTDNDAAIQLATASMRAVARYDLGDLDDIIRYTDQTANKKLQFEAIQALALSSQPNARKALRELAEHPDWLVRTTAIQTLDPKNSDDNAVLTQATNDAYAIVRETAQGILNHG